MEWQRTLLRDAIRSSADGFDLLYHVGLRPPAPPEYVVPGLVGLTFRLRERPHGGFVYATLIDAAAAIGIGARLGLDAAAAIAMVDSHERIHIELQLGGVSEEAEEAHSHFVDAVWLSLFHPRAAALVESGEFGLVTRVGDGFWELVVDPGAPPAADAS